MRRSPPSLVVTVLLVLFTLLPSVAQAQFDVRKPNEVGTVFMPFTALREADDSLAFLLEDLVGAKLRRQVKRPVYVGRDVTVALTGTPSSCLRDLECVRLLGGQFNSSLVASVVVQRSGSDVQIAVDFYTTGNGLKTTRESFSFPVGSEDLMLEEMGRLLGELFEPSLLIRPGATEGGVMSRSNDKRVAELERSRRKKVSSRREDFGSTPPSRIGSAPEPGDLRGELNQNEEEDAERGVRSTTTTPKTKQQEELVADVSDFAEADKGSRPEDLAPGGAPEREDPALDNEADTSPREDEPEEISLSKSQTTGDSVANWAEAQRLGMGKREYNRMARSGLPFGEYQTRRWAYGKRFHLKVQGFYGLGGLTRRYATTIFVRAGNVRTEEFGWESLGASWVNPGGQIGVGFAPIDVLEVYLDVGVMYGTQDLRREYNGQEIGSNIPQLPESAPTAHVVADLGARFLLLPKKKVYPSDWVPCGNQLCYNVTGMPPAATLSISIAAANKQGHSSYFGPTSVATPATPPNSLQ